MFQKQMSDVASNFVHVQIGALGALTRNTVELADALEMAEAIAADPELAEVFARGVSEAVAAGYPARDAVLVLAHLRMCQKELFRRTQLAPVTPVAALLH